MQNDQWHLRFAQKVESTGQNSLPLSNLFLSTEDKNKLTNYPKRTTAKVAVNKQMALIKAFTDTRIQFSHLKLFRSGVVTATKDKKTAFSINNSISFSKKDGVVAEREDVF